MIDTHTVTEKRAECLNPVAEPEMLPLRAEISQIWNMVHEMKANQEEAIGQMQIQAAETSKLLKLVESNFSGFVNTAISRAKEAFVAANRMDHYQDQNQKTGPQRKDWKGKGKEAVRPALPRTHRHRLRLHRHRLRHHRHPGLTIWTGQMRWRNWSERKLSPAMLVLPNRPPGPQQRRPLQRPLLNPSLPVLQLPPQLVQLLPSPWEVYLTLLRPRPPHPAPPSGQQ